MKDRTSKAYETTITTTATTTTTTTTIHHHHYQQQLQKHKSQRSQKYLICHNNYMQDYVLEARSATTTIVTSK